MILKVSIIFLFILCLLGLCLVSCSDVEEPAWIEITDRNLDSLLQIDEKLVVLTFSDSSDVLCRESDSIVFKIAHDLKDSILVGRVEVDKYSQLARSYGISSIPAFRFIRNGKVKRSTVGVLKEAEINYLITAIDGMKLSDSPNVSAGR